MDKKLKELKALSEHMLGHNEHHAEELKGLADRAKELGNEEAYKYLLDSVDKLISSNEALKKALNALPEEV